MKHYRFLTGLGSPELQLGSMHLLFVVFLVLFLSILLGKAAAVGEDCCHGDVVLGLKQCLGGWYVSKERLFECQTQRFEWHSIK